MSGEISNSCVNFQEIKDINMANPDGGSMTKEDRKQLVLGFMEEHPLALPPTVWYRNLRLHRTVTFSKDSLGNYFKEFVEQGLVARVDKEALDKGQIKTISDDDYRAYYIITDSGREYLRD